MLRSVVATVGNRGSTWCFGREGGKTALKLIVHVILSSESRVTSRRAARSSSDVYARVAPAEGAREAGHHCPGAVMAGRITNRE